MPAMAERVPCGSFVLSTGVAEVGDLELLTTPRGLLAVLFCGDRRSRATTAWVRRNAVVSGPAAPADRAMTQLLDFLAGRRRTFDLPLHRTGTPFQRAVLDEVARIPWGETLSYGEIAARVGRPAASRAVGAANGANPLPLVIPCHRVVGSVGRLTGFGGGLPMKRWLLNLEAGGLLARAY